MRDRTKLRTFELADEVVMLVYRTTARFPKEELFGLTSQIRRAAVSVPSNIVEGCARDSGAEYLGFLNIAFGSLRELHYQLNLSKRLGFLRNEDSSLLEPKVVETTFSLQPEHLSSCNHGEIGDAPCMPRDSHYL
jgi:four helix bundle protein